MDIDKVIKTLSNGGLVVMPTDTIYGICAKASDQAAASKLYKIKNRSKKPGTLIAASIDQLVDLGIKRRYLKPIEHFWPGAVSVVIPTGFGLKYLDHGVGTLAMRVVADLTLTKILEQTGPLLTTSANLPDQPPANTIKEAKQYFGDKIDLYIDGGDLSGQEPSTVIRVVDDAIEILREGAVKIDEQGRIKQ